MKPAEKKNITFVDTRKQVSVININEAHEKLTDKQKKILLLLV